MSSRVFGEDDDDDDDGQNVTERRRPDRSSDEDSDESFVEEERKEETDVRPSLVEALHHRSIRVAGTKKLIPYTAQQATAARDALAKALYEKLFAHVVQRCNAALSNGEEDEGKTCLQRAPVDSEDDDDDDEGFVVEAPATGADQKKKKKMFIGILDIYGFEIFADGANSLDQLLINYANEALQVAFNRDVLVAETDRYREEGIEWAGVDLQDSRACLDLIVKPPNGILVQLDEQVKLGARGSDLDFLGCIDRLHLPGKKNAGEGNPFYSKPRFEREAFTVHHFADAVTYSAHGFLKKNVDPLSGDLAEVVRSSTDAAIASWYPPPPEGEGARQLMRRTLTESTSKKFRDQMSRLSQELEECRKHYVRCVRPNARKSPDEFHMDLVLQQLRHFGLLDVVRIRRLGFPERKNLRSFWNAYWRLVPDGPRDARWHAFADRLPKAVSQEGLYAAYRRALPESEPWRAWAAKREPMAAQVDTLEEKRVAAATVNDGAAIEALTQQIDALKARLADPSGEFAPPDVETAVRMLCTMVLERDEWAVGRESRQLYTKLGVTQRLDEMLAKSMGVEVSLASQKRAQLSQLVNERVTVEAAATLQLQKLARARHRLREYQQSRGAARLLENRARVLLARREAEKLRDARLRDFAASRDRARADVEALTAKHVRACDLIDAAGLADDDRVSRLHASAHAALETVEAALAEADAAADSVEASKRAADKLNVALGVAREAVDDESSAVHELGAARSQAAVHALAASLEDALAFAERFSADADSATRAALEAAQATPRALVEGLKYRVHKEHRVATLAEVDAASAALFDLDTAVRAHYLDHLGARLAGLEARHAAVVAEAENARVESRDDVAAAVKDAATALSAALAALGADIAIADEERDDGTRAATVVARRSDDDLVENEAAKKYGREGATSAKVDAAERKVRAEEDLFEATASARALADLSECRARRVALLQKARRAPGSAAVEDLPDVVAALAALDETLAAPTEGLAGAALVAVADAAVQSVQALTRVVDDACAAAKAATRMEATFRARREREAYLRRVAAAKTVEAASRGAARAKSFRLKKNSALVLEAALRGFVARTQFAETLRKRDANAATAIQTWWRGALARACLRFVQRLSAPWQGVLPSKHEFVLCSTVVVWHRYTNMGRMGEVVGSRKLNLIVTNKGNLVFASGGVSVYNLEATPAAVKVIRAAKDKTAIVLPAHARATNTKKDGNKKLPAGREQPAVVVDPDLPPQPMPVTRFEIKVKKGVRTVTTNITDLAGTYARWSFLKDIFDSRDWAALTPNYAMRLNLDESIANLPIDVCGFVFKSPFKRRVLRTNDARASITDLPRDSDVFDLPQDLKKTYKEKKREEKERFFILQGGLLRYFKHEADDVPKGQLCLPVVGGVASEATIDLGPEPLQFTVKTAVFPEGITMRAHDQAELDVWLKAIEAAIKSDLKLKSRMIQQKKALIDPWLRDPGSPKSSSAASD
mmetsp:Transcript_23907/g.73632  ORF Transcript_23907/g.73632 Transcript_23907/m.73632 type:complete len:1481 (+) Transcript_23907:128-4570(+)